MGFGTLFFGYFLLLNITNYLVSDAIAGVIMLLGLLKLKNVNRRFAFSYVVGIVFTVFGFGELAVFLIDMLKLSPAFVEGAVPYLALLRHLIVAALTVGLLGGMEEVSREVGLEKIPDRCRALSVSSFLVFGLWIVLEAPLPEWIPTPVFSVLFLLAIISLLVLIIAVLTTIYGCYMRICMPGEENGRVRKPSKFGFVNEYRERQAEKEREMEEYRIKRLRERKKGGRK